jgi:hypothetical protein
MNKDDHHYKNKKPRNDKFLFFNSAKDIQYLYEPKPLEQITLRKSENKSRPLQPVVNDRTFYSGVEKYYLYYLLLYQLKCFFARVCK